MAKAKVKAAPATQQRSIAPLVLLFALWYLLQGGGVIIAPTTQITAAVYVYEKDQHALPSPVMAAINKLNRERKIVATTFEHDTKNGVGEVPTQYKAAVAAATQAGLPAFVVSAGQSVVRVVVAPKTEAEILEAAR